MNVHIIILISTLILKQLRYAELKVVVEDFFLKVNNFIDRN